MIERHDIDALLIGALYGELTPADEARLTAHLEAHPYDKAALADLTVARNAVRESRFLTVQLEPPQAVSALLLQEASRRAKPLPKEPTSEGWFSRFVNSFARHPAMAAAAMLVIVIGVAGTMYVRNGSQNAERTTQSLRDEAAPAMAPSVEADRGGDGDARRLEGNAGSAYQAQLADPSDTVAATPTTGSLDKGDKAKLEEGTARKGRVKDAEEAKQANNEKKPARTYMQPETKAEPKPMDLDETKQESPKSDDFGYRNTRPGAGGGGAVPQAPRPAPPPPTGAPRTEPPKTVVGRAPTGGNADDVANRDGKEQSQRVDEETRWAREQHGKVAAAVRANNCKEATSLALALFNRAPTYFSSNVEGDRDLKQCMTYITAERDREIERTQRARAQQRRNADEAMKRSPDKAPAPTTNK